jgi:hypothetical protein
MNRILRHAIAQAVSCWILITEAWLHSQHSPCEICGGQNGTGQAFLQQLRLSTATYLLMLHTHLSPRGGIIDPFEATVPRNLSLTPVLQLKRRNLLPYIMKMVWE